MSDWIARRQAGEKCDPAEFTKTAPTAGTPDTTPESIDTPVVVMEKRFGHTLVFTFSGELFTSGLTALLTSVWLRRLKG